MLPKKNQKMLQVLIHLIKLLKIFCYFKATVDKLGINELNNFPRGLNNLKTKVDDLDVDKLKTVPLT